MPEELSKAAGIAFVRPAAEMPRASPRGRRQRSQTQTRLPSAPSQPESDFSAFLEVLRARCEVWRLEGSRDWRRECQVSQQDDTEEPPPASNTLHHVSRDQAVLSSEEKLNAEGNENEQVLPSYYQLNPTRPVASNEDSWSEAIIQAVDSASEQSARFATVADIAWMPTTIRVYGRQVQILNALGRVTFWRFHELCGSNFGPADYISMASMFSTFILADVPVLTALQKNEARRFITLLDALYEAKCKLLIRAAAPPDEIFFPETRSQANTEAVDPNSDGVYPETMSEVYQDRVSPFRPNVSTYQSSASTPSYESSPLPRSDEAAPIHTRRSILADEDSDFGPWYPSVRTNVPTSRKKEISSGTLRDLTEPPRQDGNSAIILDFQKTGAFTGEDEYFAYKRAVSRLWEMCSTKWWDRNEDGWWTPVRPELRIWEQRREAASLESSPRPSGAPEHDSPTSTSPFRTISEPPPKFSWVHAWGMMRWGKKAGRWGEGVDGVAAAKK